MPVQAISRMWRYGQKRPTFIYRLYYNGTVQYNVRGFWLECLSIESLTAPGAGSLRLPGVLDTAHRLFQLWPHLVRPPMCACMHACCAQVYLRNVNKIALFKRVIDRQDTMRVRARGMSSGALSLFRQL